MLSNQEISQNDAAQKLINAAVTGNLKRVLNSLDKVIDINSIANASLINFRNTHNQRVTALSAATAYGKTIIVAKLLRKHAKVVPTSQANFDFPDWGIHALICYIMCNKFDDDFKILHMLLQNTKNILPQFHSGYGYTGMLQTINAAKPETLPFFYLEAISRNEITTINEFIEKGVQIPSENEFKIFLSHRHVSSQFAVDINNGLDYLVRQKKLSNDTGQAFKILVEPNISITVKLDSFPKELKHYLASLAKNGKGRSIQELYAQFRSLFCPEEHLPLVTVDSLAFKLMDNSPYLDPELTEQKAIECIRNLQNPTSFIDLMQLDPINIIMRLSACREETGDNPAALLLAEILLFKCEELPTFTHELQKNCMKILTKLYALTDYEIIFLHSYKSQSEKITVLQRQNEILESKMDAMQKSLTTLTSQNEKILQLLLDKTSHVDGFDSNNEASKPTLKRSSRLF
jgi:hypothetical protein